MRFLVLLGLCILLVGCNMDYGVEESYPSNDTSFITENNAEPLDYEIRVWVLAPVDFEGRLIDFVLDEDYDYQISYKNSSDKNKLSEDNFIRLLEHCKYAKINPGDIEDTAFNALWDFKIYGTRYDNCAKESKVFVPVYIGDKIHEIREEIRTDTSNCEELNYSFNFKKCSGVII